MRQHKLALCKDHFLEWVLEQTERNIKKYSLFSKNDRILVVDGTSFSYNDPITLDWQLQVFNTFFFE